MSSNPKDTPNSEAFREQSRRDRAAVRKKMNDLRERIRDLELAGTGGKDNRDDIESCKGEMQVLKKELQSIKEGGHATFVAAKGMLEPKKGISSKNLSINFRRVKLNRTIAQLEAKLTEPELTSEERKKVLAELAELKKKRTTLSQEKKALKEYNHTRFMEFHKEAEPVNKQEAEIEAIDKKIFTAETRLDEALENGDEALAQVAKEDLHLHNMEKESILNFSHDLFLKNLEQLKAKRKSELK